VAGSREAGHVDADLGDEVLRGGRGDAGNLIQLGHLARERGDRLVDPAGQLLDLGAERIDPVQHHPQQVAVMVAEVPGQRLPQNAGLAAHGAAGQLRKRGRVALPGDQRLQHRPAGDTEDVADHH
jgi:hypothetical protein